MTMQVSKGEFDRRVKLLEQKVQSSTNDLINRLQAESEAFIEKLRNTQLDIDTLREEIENIDPDNPELDSILNNFIKGYNNFASNTLRINDVFDSDGQFDGSRIRPLSIETAALSVGTRSQQLDLNGVEFRILPYTNSNNAGGKGYLEIINSKNSKYHFVDDTYIQYGSDTSTKKQKDIAGYMFHYGFGTNTTPKIYKINERRFDIKTYLGNNYDDTKGIYIYAKLASQTTNKFEEILNVDDVYFYSYLDKLYTSESDNSKVYTNNYDHYSNSTTYYTIQGNNLSNAEITNETEFLRKINDLYTITQVTISSFAPGIDYYYFNQNVNNVLLKAAEYKSDIQYYTKTKLNLPTKSGTIYYIKRSIEDVTNTATTETNAQEAEIIISHDKLTVDNFNNYLTIKLGYINIGMATAKGTYERKIDMTYGQTTIDGRLITTGKIEGNNCSFDLDTGEISGVVSYGLTTAQLGSALNTIYGTATSAQDAVNNMQVGGRNLLLNTSNMNSIQYPHVKGGGYYNSFAASEIAWNDRSFTITLASAISSSSYKDLAIKSMVAVMGDEVKAGKTYTIRFQISNLNTTNDFVVIMMGYRNGTWYSGQFYVEDILTWNGEYKRTFTLSSDTTGWMFFIRARGGSSAGSKVTLSNFKLEEGNKATDWTPAPEDMEEGGWIDKTRILYKSATSTPSAPTFSDNTEETSVNTSLASNNWYYDLSALATYIDTNCDSTYKVYKTTESYKLRDGKIKNYNCSVVQYDDPMTTNIIAMKSKPLQAGGLYIGSKIGVTPSDNYTSNECAFLINHPNGYAFFAGNQDPSQAPVWIKRNGTARFQNLFFNGSVIANKETNPEFGIHTTSISPSFNKEYKNTQINTNTSFNMSLYPVNKDVYNGIITLEDFGPFSLTEVNDGYLSFNVEFDYEIIISSGRADKNGTIGFYLKYGPNRTALSVSGNPSFTPATPAGSIFGHCSQNGIKFTGLTGGNYEYILQFLLSENGNISNVSLRVFNIRISCQNTIPNLNYGFHIYTNGIIFYKNDSNYFILYDSGNKGLKCLNSLGL